jgi:heme A synthase
LIFCATAVFAMATSHAWNRVSQEARFDAGSQRGLKFVSLAGPLVLFTQSVLGALVRHLGMALHEHLAGAIFATAVTVTVVATNWRTGHRWLRSASFGLLLVVIVQLLLGASAWVTRFGFPPTGYVAVQQAPEQILFRTAHAVTAMFVLMMSVQLAVRVRRLSWLCGARFKRASSISAVAVGTLETCPTIEGAVR